jgi:hypothetical protein
MNDVSVPPKRELGALYTDREKVKLVADWVKTGNLSASCKKLGINYLTAVDWKKTEGWKELVDKYREELDVRLSSKIDEIVDISMAEIQERLKGGEYILDSKTGSIIRIPPKARDLAQITKLLTDRQDILIKRKKVENNDTATIKDKLTDLAATFASFAKQTNVKKPDIVDAEFEIIEGEPSSPT